MWWLDIWFNWKGYLKISTGYIQTIPLHPLNGSEVDLWFPQTRFTGSRIFWLCWALHVEPYSFIQQLYDVKLLSPCKSFVCGSLAVGTFQGRRLVEVVGSVWLYCNCSHWSDSDMVYSANLNWGQTCMQHIYTVGPSIVRVLSFNMGKMLQLGSL